MSKLVFAKRLMAGVQCPAFPRSSVGVSRMGLVAVGGCAGDWDKDPKEGSISSTMKSQGGVRGCEGNGL